MHAILSSQDFKDTGDSVSEEEKMDDRRDQSGISRHATWCGLVLSLAVILTAINVCPPSSIQYQVRSEVVVAASRVSHLASIADQAETETSKIASLTRVKVLDSGEGQLQMGEDVPGTDVSLVEIKSLWNRRCTEESHLDWLKQVTKIDSVDLAETDVARQKRLDSWKLSVAQHYVEHHDFLASKPPVSTSTDGRVFELSQQPRADESSRGVPASLASFGRPQDVDADSIGELTESEMRRVLENQLAKQREDSKESQAAWQEIAANATGLVRVASTPEVLPQTSFVPSVIVFSVLFLGVVVGVGGTWGYRQLQSGGAYVPENTASELALQGLPVSGAVTLPHHEKNDDGWQDRLKQRVHMAGQWLGRNLILVSEIVIGCWAFLVLVRIVFDPIWRSVLWDSPLIALSHLLVGMP